MANLFGKKCSRILADDVLLICMILVDGNVEDEAIVHKAGRKDNTYTLDIGDTSVPILPNYDEMDLGTRKAVVRVFLNWHYGK